MCPIRHWRPTRIVVGASPSPIAVAYRIPLTNPLASATLAAMTLSRRDFFKLAIAAGAVASLPLSLVAAARKLAPPVPLAPAAPSLTFVALEMAYQSCCYGNIKPDLIVLPPGQYAQLGQLFEQHTQCFSASSEAAGGAICLQFNGAAVSWDERLAPDVIGVITTKARDPRYSGLFRLPSCDYSPWVPLGAVA